MAENLQQFRFKAYGEGATTESGFIEAEDVTDATRRLAKRGKTPFEIKPVLGKTDTKAKNGSAGLFAPKLDLVILFADLAVMLNSGFNIDASLKAVAETQAKKGQKELILAIHSRISEGSSVADAFAGEPGVPSDVVALIASGESGGHMADVFSELSKTYSLAAEQRSKIIEALLYPAFLMIVLFGTLLLLSVYLVPALEPIFENGGGERPMVVTVLSAFGHIITNYWPAIVAGVALLLLFILAGMRSASGRRAIWGLTLRIPLIGAILRRSAKARYLHSMALLLANGVPLNESMRLSAAGTPIEQYQQDLDGAREAVSSGSSFWSAVGETDVFEGSMISLFKLGEESNNLAAVLSRAAAMSDMLLQRSISRVLAFLTPAITIFMGLMVGTLVISVMTTLLSVNELAIR